LRTCLTKHKRRLKDEDTGEERVLSYFGSSGNVPLNRVVIINVFRKRQINGVLNLELSVFVDSYQQEVSSSPVKQEAGKKSHKL